MTNFSAQRYFREKTDFNLTSDPAGHIPVADYRAA
jgi:hypothetical protein